VHLRRGDNHKLGGRSSNAAGLNTRDEDDTFEALEEAD